jgi:putative intracellular protease/amidase
VAGELKAAGASYLDQAFVSDGNLIASRQPRDLRSLIDKILEVVRQSRRDP